MALSKDEKTLFGKGEQARVVGCGTVGGADAAEDPG